MRRARVGLGERNTYHECERIDHDLCTKGKRPPSLRLKKLSKGPFLEHKYSVLKKDIRRLVDNRKDCVQQRQADTRYAITTGPQCNMCSSDLNMF